MNEAIFEDPYRPPDEPPEEGDPETDEEGLKRDEELERGDLVGELEKLAAEDATPSQPQKINRKRLREFNESQGQKSEIRSKASQSRRSTAIDVDNIWESASQVRASQRDKMSMASKNDEDNRGLNKITKQALSQLDRDPKQQLRNLPPSKQFSETQSGIKSLVIQKRIQAHQHNIFGENAEPETDLTKNMAYQEAFKRYLKDMEQEAIRDKRISMEEYARLNSYDTTAKYKDDQKRIMRSNFRQ